jgi:hypothetical protein
MEIEQVISELKNLDLSNNSDTQVKELIEYTSNLGYINTTFYPGKIIERAIPYTLNEDIKTIDRISFMPSHLNNSYRRASTPTNTMFMGAY